VTAQVWPPTPPRVWATEATETTEDFATERTEGTETTEDFATERTEGTEGAVAA
jgi:hypothetical protein